MPSTQDEIAAVEAHLAGLRRKAEEERERAEAAERVVAAAIAADKARLAAAKAEAAKKAVEAEAAEKAASAKKAAGRKGKRPAPEVEEIVVDSDESDNDNDNDEEGSLVVPTKKCNRCARLGEECRFAVGPRMSACTVCRRAAKACVRASGLPAKLQRRIERKSDRSPQRKKVKSAPFVIPDSDDEDGEAEYVEESPSVRTKGKGKGKGKAAEKGKGKAVEKGKGKAKAAEKTPAAEKPLAPGEVRWTFVAPPGVEPPAQLVVPPVPSSAPRRSSPGVPGGSGSRAAGPAPALDKSDPHWSVDPEQLTDHELLQHLLVEMQQNRRTSGRVADLLAGEEAHREELWRKERKALQAAVAEPVRTEMKIELGISVRQMVRDELREQLEEFLQEFQEVMMTGNRPPHSEAESDDEEERGSGGAGSEEEGAGEEEERGRSGSRGRAESRPSAAAEEAQAEKAAEETAEAGEEGPADMDMDTA
ncbi:hypothetical protein GY45DRAFT_1376193 [Cubamyces sp. BRFM 1775]|nr:hypothetical protein GY45DRAFT_1376193 [Cubamyces sp. BRFM 1775]